MTLLYGFQLNGTVWRYLLTRVVGVLPLYLELASDLGKRTLSDLLSSFAEDEELVMHSVAQMLRQGFTFQALADALNRAGVKLESVVATVEQFHDDSALYPLFRFYADAASMCRQALKVG